MPRRHVSLHGASTSPTKTRNVPVLVDGVRNTLQEAKLQDYSEDPDKQKIQKALYNTIAWLERAQPESEGKAAIESKRKELEGIVNPIMTKIASILERALLEAKAFVQEKMLDDGKDNNDKEVHDTLGGAIPGLPTCPTGRASRRSSRASPTPSR